MPPRAATQWPPIAEAKEYGKGKELAPIHNEPFVQHADAPRPKDRHVGFQRVTSSPPQEKYENRHTKHHAVTDKRQININIDLRDEEKAQHSNFTSRKVNSKQAQVSHSIGRKVDGFLTPDSGDLTVHLEYDLQEDLEEYMEEWMRFSRLGQFNMARKLFEESFQHHSKTPYILVQHANLLLQQGKFKAVIELDGGPIDDLEKISPQYEGLHLLRLNWELIKLSARRHTLDPLNDISAVFDDVALVLRALELPEAPIGSTEIKILGLSLQVTGNAALNTEWLVHRQNVVNALPTLLERLYPTLLREGRIWDFHDLLILMPTVRDLDIMLRSIFHTSLIASLKTVVLDWSATNDQHDTSTTLALLSILTHIVLEPLHTPIDQCIEIMNLSKPLALSILDHDPTNIKTRPYLRFLLAHSRFIDMTSHRAVSSLVDRLRSSPGVCFHAHASQLPIYVPTATETHDWVSIGMPPDVKESANLVCRAAREFEDTRTEILSLQELIRLSGHPQKEFDKLCELQEAEGDLIGYGESLASTYLIAKTTSERDALESKITRLSSRLDNLQFWDPNCKWAIKMIMYKLRLRSPLDIRSLLNKEIRGYLNMDTAFLGQISRKMPELEGWVGQQLTYNRMYQGEDLVLPKLKSHSYIGIGERGENVRNRRIQEQVEPEFKPTSSAEPKEEPQEPGQTFDLPTPIERNNGNHHRRKTTGPERRRPIIETAEYESDELEASEDERVEYEREVTRLRGEMYALQRDENRARQDLRAAREGYESKVAELEHKVAELEREGATRQEVEARLQREHEEREHQLKCENAETLKEERHKHEEQLAAVRTASNAQIDRIEARSAQMNQIEARSAQMFRDITSIEAQRDAMRKAITDLAYEYERQAEVTRREAEGREKMAKDRRLEGERLISTISRVAVERENTIRRLEEQILVTAAQADRDNITSFSAAQKSLEAAERVAIQSRERDEKVKNQTEIQELESKLRVEAGRLNSQAEPRKQQLEEPEGEIRSQDNNSRFVHFEDALGRKFVFPFETCKTWVGMENLINMAFQQFDDIGPHIQAGSYELFVDDAIILPKVWESFIKPGSEVTMYMRPMSSSKATSQESRSDLDESYFDRERPIEDVDDSECISLRDEPFQNSSPRLGSQYSSGHVPPPVPEVPVYPHEQTSSLARESQSPLLTLSPRRGSRAATEDSEVEENLSTRSRRTISSYPNSTRSEIEAQGSSSDVPRRRQRSKGFFSTWRLGTLPVGVAQTVSDSSLSPNRARADDDILDE